MSTLEATLLAARKEIGVKPKASIARPPPRAQVLLFSAVCTSNAAVSFVTHAFPQVKLDRLMTMSPSLSVSGGAPIECSSSREGATWRGQSEETAAWPSSPAMRSRSSRNDRAMSVEGPLISKRGALRRDAARNDERAMSVDRGLARARRMHGGKRREKEESRGSFNQRAGDAASPERRPVDADEERAKAMLRVATHRRNVQQQQQEQRLAEEQRKVCVLSAPVGSKRLPCPMRCHVVALLLSLLVCVCGGRVHGYW